LDNLALAGTVLSTLLLYHHYFLRTTSVEITKKKGFGRFNLAGYWKKKYRGKVLDEGWFILTNLDSLSETLEIYQARMGIEALFKDCKTGGYNLENSQACSRRLSSLILLIAIAYTCAVFQGTRIKQMDHQKYVSRQTEKGRSQRRHSDFWVGLYGQMWIPSLVFFAQIIQQLLALSPAHNLHYQRGFIAMSSIEQAVYFSSSLGSSNLQKPYASHVSVTHHPVRRKIFSFPTFTLFSG
jgi:hypothetical protein